MRTGGARAAGTGRDMLLAVLSGALLTASFPPGKLDFLAWIALVPLLAALHDASPSRAFRLGFTAGLAHYLTLVYWIIQVLGRYGGLNILANIGILLLFCCYLALYPSFFCIFHAATKDAAFSMFVSATAWVGLEYTRSFLLSGFPWCLLGYSQYRHLDLIQIADTFGVYGISFLIVLVNGLVHRLLSGKGPAGRAPLKWQVLVISILVAGTMIYGRWRLRENRPEIRGGRPVRIAVIQGNMDQSVKWDPAYQVRTLKVYHRWTLKTRPFRPDLVVWPETALPFFFQDDAALAASVVSMASESGAALIFGSPAHGKAGKKIRYYNRAYLVTPDERPFQYYDKVHLVPFGEYVPFGKFLFFVGRLVPAAGDFARGKQVMPFKWDHLCAGVLICFESIFPELARAHARKGAVLLVNITNDAWFGMTSAPYQHLSMAVFRAVETRIPLVRAANTGFSAFIGRDGAIRSRTALFQRGVLEGTLRAAPHPPTFYTRFGDVFAFLMLVISLAWMILTATGTARRKHWDP